MAKILLVEDDQFLSDLYNDLLKDEGYEVALANNGEDALKEIMDGQFDLVLLDIMLPKKDGLTVLKQLGDEGKKKAGQVVMLTNLGQEAIIQEAINAGATGYLIKSALAPDQLLDKVRNFLGVKPAEAA